MGVVTDYINDFILKLVESHRFVIWFDPEGHYREIFEYIDAPSLRKISFEIEQMEQCELFPFIEPLLQKTIETALVEDARGELVGLARNRKKGFWSRNQSELEGRWHVAALAGELLIHLAELAKDMKSSKASS